MSERFAWADYCDDVRQEIGNKLSLMGCYGSDLFTPAFPLFLPKLCVVAKFATPVDRPFKKGGAVRVYRDDQPIAEMQVMNPSANGVPQPPPYKKNDVRWMVLHGVVIMSPFAVDEPCILTVKLETDDDEIIGPHLHIRPNSDIPKLG